MCKDHQVSGKITASFPVFSSSVSPSPRKETSLNNDNPPKASLSILIAEDDPVSRLFLARMLTKLGHNVQSVADGQKVLDLLESTEPFDLLLTDIKMPHVDGVDLSRKLRSSGRYQHRLDLTIIAITAYSAPGDRGKYLQAGIDDFLPKPIDGRLLQMILDQQSARHQ